MFVCIYTHAYRNTHTHTRASACMHTHRPKFKVLYYILHHN